MNKEAITVGDVYKHNEYDDMCVLLGYWTGMAYGQLSVVYDNGESQTFNPEIFFRNWHKIGHIEKFAEALKELQEMAENI